MIVSQPINFEKVNSPILESISMKLSESDFGNLCNVNSFDTKYFEQKQFQRAHSIDDFSILNMNIRSMQQNLNLLRLFTNLLKGSFHGQTTPYFYCLDRSRSLKLSESKKPHAKIFSRSRNIKVLAND